jgi:protein O-GlcNAc transferase
MVKLTINQVLQQGVDAHKAGQVQEAHRLYAAILKVQPKHPDANHNTGLLAVGDGKIELALPFFKTALEANPSIAQFWYSHIVALIKLERLLDAKVLLDQAKSKGIKGANLDQLEQRLNDANKGQTKSNNSGSDEHGDQSKILGTLNLDQALRLAKKKANEGYPEEAKRIYQDILEKFPGNKKALAFKPDYADAYYKMGIALQVQGKLEEAIEAYNKALAIKPDYAGAYYNMGIALQVQGKLEEAIEAYKKALSIKPDYAIAYNNMGNALKDQGKLEEAIEAYNKVLSFKPDYVDAYYNMGNALKDQGKLDEAIAFYNKALFYKPDYAVAYYNMGNALLEQSKPEEAIEAYSKALAIKPDYAAAYNNIGTTLKDRGKPDEAIVSYNKALAIKPDYVDAYYNMGTVLQDQGNLEEAIEAYSKALAIKPDYENARTLKLHQQAHICNWDSIAEDVNLIPELGTLKKHVSPFVLLSLEDAPDRHLTRSKIYAKANYPQKTLPPKARPSKRPKRIRIGYFSSDFKEHPVAYLIAKALEQHNRDQFEVFGYSIYGDKKSEMRQRLEKSFDSFADVQSMSDRDIALQARQDEIDIAVDLNGFTQYARTGIFAYRAAPIQINYLGYPGTMGSNFMDYIVADKFLIPGENQKYFNEKPLYLPNTYMPTDDSRELSQKPMNRSDMGLPDDAFVFCCFNNNYKISPTEFDIWMRSLTKVENSVLWLRNSNQISNINMKNEAQKRNVDPSRLVFADKVPMDEHLARHRLADLFVDTFAFNAHTTATEALWAGLPVVTKTGVGFAARVAGSLLNAVGLPELVTETERGYEALILELATNPTKLAKIKEKLATNRLTQPLFNTELYTKHLESGYQQAYQNYFQGKLPQTIIVPK